jgi:hypothetical protein
VATSVDADEVQVTELLGRRPAGAFEVVVRDASGPVVIRNAPLLDDGTPMPTRYWLVGPQQVRAVSRLEAAGGVRAAEAAVDAGELAAAHARYAAERDAHVPDDAAHRPSGGVGGTRQGVKCLHAHYAHHLAGGDDPVGRWVAAQLGSRLEVEVGEQIVARVGVTETVLPTTSADLLAELDEADPPSPQSLTNAIGAVADDIDNLLRHVAPTGADRSVDLLGEETWHLAAVERGDDPDADVDRVTISRDDLEDLFRTLATEHRAARLHNPALRSDRVDTILATCCAVLAFVRRLDLGAAVAVRPHPAPVH